MAAVSFSAAAKKAAEVFLSSDKGRKILGYAIAITVLLILLPLIILVGLFGFMSGGNLPLDNEQILDALSFDDKAFVNLIEDTGSEIVSVFAERGLNENDIEKAKALYMSCLIGKESDSFVTDLAFCFENVTKEISVYDNICEKFFVELSANQRKSLDDRFGITE